MQEVENPSRYFVDASSFDIEENTCGAEEIATKRVSRKYSMSKSPDVSGQWLPSIVLETL